jgi:hypothetical protein
MPGLAVPGVPSAGDLPTGTAQPAAPAPPGAASSPSASPDPWQLSYADPLDFSRLTDGAVPNIALRFGWWAVHNDGSTVKTGEFQDLHSSPFYDVDGLFTTGKRTINFVVTGLDNEANHVGAQIYGPLGRVNVQFERYIRQLDHEPLTDAIISSVNPNLFVTRGILSNRPVTQAPTPVLVQDLNVGEDYAIRIEQLKTEVGYNLTDNIKFRVQLFQLRKFGERQANAMARCFHPPEFGTTGPLGPIRSCHVLSQRQQIDWNTTEVTPRLEGRWGPLTIEYAHQMRFFGQNDQIVTRLENGTGTALIRGNLPYAFVPESTTNIDQVRLGLDLTDRTRLYAFGYAGNTVNEFRGTRRDYLGYDVRLTDRTFKGLLLTAYTKGYHQNGTRPTFFLPEEERGVTETGPSGTTILKAGEDAIRDAIEYHRTTAGVSSRWQPGLGDGLLGRTSFLSGYEYVLLDREHAGFETVFLRDRARTLGIVEFDQPDTVSNQIYFGVQQPWTDSLDTEVRYKLFFIRQPLHGFREISGFVNTNLPEQKHVLEFVETWRPLPNLGLLCQQDIDLRRQDEVGPVVPNNLINFHEQSYAFVNSLWYAPTEKLTLSASAAWMSNWINQIINLGDEYVDPTQPPPPPGGTVPTDSRRWLYGGRAAILGSYMNYRLTETVFLHGGYEWVRGDDRISTRNLDLIGAGRPGAQPWIDLPEYSKVLVVTQRLTAGIDWKPRELLSIYFRYVYFDFEDKRANFNSGTAHMFLAGLALVR